MDVTSQLTDLAVRLTKEKRYSDAIVLNAALIRLRELEVYVDEHHAERDRDQKMPNLDES